MFTNVSMTGTGIAVVVVTGFLGLFGIIPQEGQILQLLSDFLTVLGWVWIILGQLRRGDMKWFLLRK